MSSESTFAQACETALKHHQAGRPVEAESLYRQLLSANLNCLDDLLMLARMTHQFGRHADAVDVLRRAIDLYPRSAECHTNLGMVLAMSGQIDPAIAAFQAALALWSNSPETHNNLANALRSKGLVDESVAVYRQAIALRPAYLEAHINLARTLQSQRRWDEAIDAFTNAIRLCPNDADLHNTLASLLQLTGRLDEAIAAFRRAVALRPNFADAHNNLGGALQARGHLVEAGAAYRRALAAQPDFAAALSNLGNVLKSQGELDEAIHCIRRAEALKLDPRIGSNLLFTLHSHPDYDRRRLFQEHARWNQAYAQPLAAQPPSAVIFTGVRPAGGRRLRIGFFSPDFRNHPVSWFLLPLLENRDRTAFEVFCYAEVPRPDPMTDRVRALADEWRSTIGLVDDQVAQMMREDRIDILVDLAMHTANRLLVFARKPAPVQVTWLAYCSTTGLQTIDYRLSDPYLDPPEFDDSCYSEKTVRLPRTYWCYQPREQTREVNQLPALASGCVTFGCLNNFGKVHPAVLAAWCRVLREVPNARLLLHAHEGDHRERARQYFQREGIDAERIEFVGYLPLSQYFLQYHRIDIALDTFPYSGATTTCDALWMGVPVVTLAGQTAVSRAGLSILSNITMSELSGLAAGTVDQYVRVATELANDLPRLTNLRAALRGQMRQSPLMDAPRFAKDVEAAFCQMWADSSAATAATS